MRMPVPARTVRSCPIILPRSGLPDDSWVLPLVGVVTNQQLGENPFNAKRSVTTPTAGKFQGAHPARLKKFEFDSARRQVHAQLATGTAGGRPRTARRKASASGWLACGAARRGAFSLRSARGAFSFGPFLWANKEKDIERSVNTDRWHSSL